MPHKRSISVLTAIFTLLFLQLPVIFTSGQDVETLKAIQQFKQGNFEEVLPVFHSLVNEQPENTLINYYYGASRTETGNYSEKDLNHLEKALEGNPPQKVNYYLAIQHHAQSNWTKALRHYNQFQLNAGAEEREKLKIAEKIQQCFNQENPFQLSEETEISDLQQEQEQERTPVAPSPNISKIDLVEEINLSSEEDEIISKNNQPVNFPVNSRITYFNTSNFKTEEGLELFLKADKLKGQLDFSAREMEDLRKEYSAASSANEKQTIGNKILAFENEALELRNEYNQLLSRATVLENNYWQNASTQEISAFEAMAAKELERRTSEMVESSMNKNVSSEEQEIAIDPGLLLEDNEPIDLLAQEDEGENELVYKIQIGAYSRGLPTYVQRLYNKLSLIRKIDNYTDENGVVVYTTGNLQNREDAIKMRDQVRQEGVKDAFVVPYFKGKRITLEEAKKLETGS